MLTDYAPARPSAATHAASRFDRRIFARVAAALLAAWALLVVLLGAGAWWTFTLAVGESRSVTQGMTRVVANQVERLFDAADLMLSQMAERAATTDWSAPGARAAAERQLLQMKSALPISFRLFLWDARGRLLATTVPDPDPTLSVADRDYFKVHVEKDIGLHVSEPLQAKIDGTPILVFSRRVSGPDGAFLGLASFSVERDEVASLYQSLDLPKGWVIAWWHETKGLLLREPPLPQDRSAVPPTAPDAIARAMEMDLNQGWASYRSPLDGQERTAHFVQVARHPVYVLVAASDKAVLLAWIQRSMPYFAVGLIAVAGCALASLFALRWAHAEDQRRKVLAVQAVELERSVAARTAELTELLAERNELLSQKDTLIQEINHRVKNSLQLIVSMLRLQSRSLPQGEARQIVEDACTRVMAVGTVHERLYAGALTGMVDVRDYFEALCAELQTTASRACRIGVEADALMLPLTLAVPLGLILNEALTNAIKHACRSGASGDIRVRFGRTGSGELRLSIEDDGPGLPAGLEIGEGSGFGMRLIGTFARQLQGRLDVESGSRGTRVAVVFPHGTD